jgi:hypothetical protein
MHERNPGGAYTFCCDVFLRVSLGPSVSNGLGNTLQSVLAGFVDSSDTPLHVGRI